MRSEAKPRSEKACPEQFDPGKRCEEPANPDCEPADGAEDSDDASDLEEPDFIDTDDARWDVFLLDDDCDPLPDHGDFWMPD